MAQATSLALELVLITLKPWFYYGGDWQLFGGVGQINFLDELLTFHGSPYPTQGTTGIYPAGSVWTTGRSQVSILSLTGWSTDAQASRGPQADSVELSFYSDRTTFPRDGVSSHSRSVDIPWKTSLSLV